MEMIKTENLTKRFGNLTAVDNLTFQVNKGEVFGLLGPNGAGKTTTIRMICCLISKSGGIATVGGLDTSDKEDAMKIRRSIGLVPDSVGLYEIMSIAQNLEYFGRLYDASEELIRENMEKYLKLLDLWDWRNKKASTLSKGMKQKVAIVRALVHDPELLIMDEPTANLDPEMAKTVREVILDLKKEGRTILLNTHNLDEAQRICTRIGVLKTKLLAVDTPENLERAVSGSKTVIRLDKIDATILNAVNLVRPKSVTSNGNLLILELADPEKETPIVVKAIASAGGKIQSVTETSASLEDVYLRLVRGE